jgi:hypothetical protein
LEICVDGGGAVRVEVYLEEDGEEAEVGAGTADAPGRAFVIWSWVRPEVVAGMAAGIWLSLSTEDRFSSAAVLGVAPSATRPAVGLMGEDE